MDQETQRELKKIEDLLSGIAAQLNLVVRAFPTNKDGQIDADGHRTYHEALIRSAEAQEKFWLDLKQDLIKKGLWTVIFVVVGLIVTGVSAKLGIRV
jgi:hypothetical protein